MRLTGRAGVSLRPPRRRDGTAEPQTNADRAQPTLIVRQGSPTPGTAVRKSLAAQTRWIVDHALVDESMTTEKVALSIPSEVLERAKEEVAAGRAKSLSAFVSAAVDEKTRRAE